MKCYIYDKTGCLLLETIEATPICEEDFCDTCGDCLACYGGEYCYLNNGEHFWVKYKDDD